MQSFNSKSQDREAATPTVAPVISIESRLAPSDRSTQEESKTESGFKQARPRIGVKRGVSIVAATILLIGGTVAGAHWYQYLSTHEDTDDAYITGHLHQVSSRIDGTVRKVLVDDNEHVKQGQLLLTLDPNDFQVVVDQAVANLEQAQRQIKTSETTVTYQDTNAQGQNMNAQGSIANATATIARSEATVRESEAGILASQA